MIKLVFFTYVLSSVVLHLFSLNMHFPPFMTELDGGILITLTQHEDNT